MMKRIEDVAEEKELEEEKEREKGKQEEGKEGKRMCSWYEVVRSCGRS